MNKPCLPDPAALANPFLLWGTFAMKTLQMSTAAAEVIAIRTGRLAAAGLDPTQADADEIARMGTEKVDAFSRAAGALASGAVPLAAGLAGQAFRTGMDVFGAATRLAAARSLPQTLQRHRAFTDTLLRQGPQAHHGAATAAARLAHRALEPVHATATGNARRLAAPK